MNHASKRRRKTPAVMVRTSDEAVAAARVAAASGRPMLIVSPPAAALFAGPAWFKALTEVARRRIAADVPVTFVLDCADAPGATLAAIRVGVEAVSFHGNARARDRLAAIAKRAGVALLEPPRDALDLSKSDGLEELTASFSASGLSLQSPRRSAKRTAKRGSAPTPKRSGSGAKRPPTRPRSGAKRP